MSKLTYDVYNNKCLSLKANRKEHNSFMKKIGGRWNSRMKGGEGWLIPKENESELKDYLNSFSNQENDSDNEILEIVKNAKPITSKCKFQKEKKLKKEIKEIKFDSDSEHESEPESKLENQTEESDQESDQESKLENQEESDQESEEKSEPEKTPISFEAINKRIIQKNGDIFEKEESEKEESGDEKESEFTVRENILLEEIRRKEAFLKEKQQRELEKKEELRKKELEKKEYERKQREESEKKEYERKELEKKEYERKESEKKEYEKKQREKFLYEKNQEEKRNQEKMKRERKKEKVSILPTKCVKKKTDISQQSCSSVDKNPKIPQKKFPNEVTHKDSRCKSLSDKVEKNAFSRFKTFSKDPDEFKKLYKSDSESSDSESKSSSEEDSESESTESSSDDDFPSPGSKRKYEKSIDRINEEDIYKKIRDLQKRVYELEMIIKRK
jgi:hypothetical protein